MKLSNKELREFLNEKVSKYNNVDFIPEPQWLVFVNGLYFLNNQADALSLALI